MAGTAPKTKAKKTLRVVGVAEAAEILGIRKQNLYRLRSNGELPEPIEELAAGPVWDRAEMEKCARERAKRK